MKKVFLLAALVVAFVFSGCKNDQIQLPKGLNEIVKDIDKDFKGYFSDEDDYVYNGVKVEDNNIVFVVCISRDELNERTLKQWAKKKAKKEGYGRDMDKDDIKNYVIGKVFSEAIEDTDVDTNELHSFLKKHKYNIIFRVAGQEPDDRIETKLDYRELIDEDEGEYYPAVEEDVPVVAAQEYVKEKAEVVSSATPVSNHKAAPAIPAGYVDLGLPSGTLWKDNNEPGLYTYYQADAKYRNDLPTKEQLEELVSSCQWTWIGNGQRVQGPNGNSITLPADGYSFYDRPGEVKTDGSYGYYWSSTSDAYSMDAAWCISLHSTSAGVYSHNRLCCYSVRLVR